MGLHTHTRSWIYQMGWPTKLVEVDIGVHLSGPAVRDWQDVKVLSGPTDPVL